MAEATPRPWAIDSYSYVGPDGEAHTDTFILGADGIEYDGSDADVALIVAAVNSHDTAMALAEAAESLIGPLCGVWPPDAMRFMVDDVDLAKTYRDARDAYHVARED